MSSEIIGGTKLKMTKEQLRVNLGIEFRKLRKDAGLSLQSVADKTGLSLGYLSQVEIGKASPSLETCYTLCEFYGVGLSEVFHRVEVKQIVRAREIVWVEDEGKGHWFAQVSNKERADIYELKNGRFFLQWTGLDLVVRACPITFVELDGVKRYAETHSSFSMEETDNGA